MSAEDDAKKTILARRARFIAAAMASVTMACGKTSTPPGPCLSVAYVADGEAPPMPCLSPIGVPRPDADTSADADASADASADATANAGADAGKKIQPVPKPTAGPVPCLSVSVPVKDPAKGR